MRFPGQPAWRFAADLSDLAHRALFVRDAARLPVRPVNGVPPPCSPVVAERPDLVGVDREAAGRQWLDWWRAIIAVEGRRLLPPSTGPGQSGVMRPPLENDLAPADPTKITSGNRPDLRTAISSLYDSAEEWARAQREADLDPGRDLVDANIVRLAARSVAHQRHVPVNTLSACVLVLDVQGRWWTIAEPGIVLASRQAVQIDVVAASVVRGAYRSATISPS